MLKEKVSSGEIIRLSSDNQAKTNAELTQLLVVTPLADRLDVLVQLLTEYSMKTLVFFNQISELQKAYYAVKRLKFAACAIYGQMDQTKRMASLSAFK